MDLDSVNKTEWNGGTFKNLRIHNIIEGIGVCAHTLNITDWLFFLQRFDKELHGFKKETEKIELDAELKALAEKVNKQNMILNNPRAKGHKIIPPQLIDDLNSYENKLWDIFTRSGLETKLMDDASQALR